MVHFHQKQKLEFDKLYINNNPEKMKKSSEINFDGLIFTALSPS